MASISTHPLITAKGSSTYKAGVLDCLRIIRGVQDGRRLLDALARTGRKVVIVDSNDGNACGYDSRRDAVPLLTLALNDRNDALFQTELTKALSDAVGKGLTPEHFARQLTNGLTPATYYTDKNVVKPKLAWTPATPNATLPKAQQSQEVMKQASDLTKQAQDLLMKLTYSTKRMADMPTTWYYDLPRLLRIYLRPGPGTGSEIDFNPTASFACADDPSMHQRPPAIGLAHEMVHALHAATGTNLTMVVRNNEKLEEVVTTGLPPYQFEDISDNKMRTQWPSRIAHRHNYVTKAGTRSVAYAP